MLVLCAERTPAAHLQRLRHHEVPHVVVGADHVDLPAGLDALAVHHQITAIRVDAGGILNAQLLHHKLVDEISIVVAPVVAAASRPAPLSLVVPDRDRPAVRLSLRATEVLRDGQIWLRYAVADH